MARNCCVPVAFRCWLVAVWIGLAPALLMSQGVQGQESLTHTYTSPQFGYSITWSSPWLQMGESTQGLDVLRLTNGISQVVLIGGEAADGNARLAAGLFVDGISEMETVSDFRIIDAGGDDTRYHITATMNVTREPGVPEPTTEYIEVRTLIPGRAIVLFDGYAPSDLYARAKFEFDLLLASLVIPAQPVCDDTEVIVACLNRPVPPLPAATPVPERTR